MRKEIEQIDIKNLPLITKIDNFEVIIKYFPCVNYDYPYTDVESREFTPHIFLSHKSGRKTMVFDRKVETTEQLQELLENAIDYFKDKFEK